MIITHLLQIWLSHLKQLLYEQIMWSIYVTWPKPFLGLPSYPNSADNMHFSNNCSSRTMHSNKVLKSLQILRFFLSVSGINFLVLCINLVSARLCPACSCSYHIFSLCQLTTLTIHNSLSLSLPPQDLPLSQIFSTTDSLPASGLTPRTSRPDFFFWASPFSVFSFFIILFCLVPCDRLRWLLVSF